MEYIFQAKNLCKKYKKQFALKDVNMNIKKGDIYGFVGENGSGKTTVIRLLTGLIHPTSGSFELFGEKNDSKNIYKARNKIGAIVETPSIYHNFSAKENLEIQSNILGIQDEEKIKNVLKEVGLYDLYDNPKKAGQFSLGMRQRLGIAMALLGDPEFIILDEPMNGLDPSGIVEIRELILKLNKENNISFLISSHILTELALVANTYGIISKGKIIKEISLEELKNECRKNIIIEVNDPEKLVATFINYHENVEFIEKGIKINNPSSINEIIEKVLSCGVEITSLNTHETNIEEYYLNLVGGNHNA